MSVQFTVDDVEPAEDPLPTRSLESALGEVLAFGGDAELRVADHGPTHALLGAVHLAFASHRPLVLSPDVMWLTVAEGFAHHVRNNNAALRCRLVAHEGKADITVVLDGPMPTDADGWTGAVDLFRNLLAEQVGEGRARLLECDFSTTGEVERTASQVVLMDAFSPYFDYFMVCVCGIPSITLLGTVEDWRSIRQRIGVLDEFECGFWTRSLGPIFDEFVAAAEGNADPTFWKRIYKPVDAYGGSTVTGWIARLYPYLKHDRLNPLLELPLQDPSGVTRPGMRGYRGVGISTDQVQSGPSRASVHVHDMVLDEKRTVVLEAGVRAVVQGDDGALTPICAWTLRNGGTLKDVIERMKRDPRVTLHAPLESAEDAPDPLGGGGGGGAADFIQLREVASKVDLFEGPDQWRFRSPDARDHIGMSTGDIRHMLELVADLPDGQFLAAVSCTSPPIFVRCDASNLSEDNGGSDWSMRRLRGNLDDLPIIAEGLAALLTLALDAGPGVELPVLRFLGEWIEETSSYRSLTDSLSTPTSFGTRDELELPADHPLSELWQVDEPWELRVRPASPVASIACVKSVRGIGGMPLGPLRAALTAATPVYTTTLQAHERGWYEELETVRAIVDALAPHGGHRFVVKVGSHIEEINNDEFRALLGGDAEIFGDV